MAIASLGTSLRVTRGKGHVANNRNKGKALI
jgi:hypothetical protein